MSDFYKEQILKTASADSIKNTVRNIRQNGLSRKAKLGIAGGLTAASGLGYAMLNDDKKQKMMEHSKNTSNVAFNKMKQSLLASAGGVAGTALSLKKGKSLRQSVRDGGMIGAAAGDIAGSAIFPVKSLYKQTKKETGKAPDKKDVAKVMAVNVLPTAGMWSLIGANKKLKKKFVNNNTRKATEVGKSVRQLKRDVDDISELKASNVGNGYDRYVARTQNPLDIEQWRKTEEGLMADRIPDADSKRLMNHSIDFARKGAKIFSNPTSNMGRGVKALGATALLASPRALAKKKKREQEKE